MGVCTLTEKECFSRKLSDLSDGILRQNNNALIQRISSRETGVCVCKPPKSTYRFSRTNHAGVFKYHIGSCSPLSVLKSKRRKIANFGQK